MNQKVFYTTAIRLIGVYLLFDSLYSLVSMALFYYQPWPDDMWLQSLLYFLYSLLPLLFAIFVIYRSEYLVKVLKLEGAEGQNEFVNFGKWDLRAIVELAVVLLSGYLILMNVVPFIAAVIDYFTDFVRLRYPYNTQPDQTAFRDQYNFITSGISILLGTTILTNVPWFVGKIMGRYPERSKG